MKLLLARRMEDSQASCACVPYHSLAGHWKVPTVPASPAFGQMGNVVAQPLATLEVSGPWLCSGPAEALVRTSGHFAQISFEQRGLEEFRSFF